MSVFTPVDAETLSVFLNQYPVGKLVHHTGIEAGIENTNFFVTTHGGEYVLTVFEQHTADELDYFLQLMRHWAAAGIPTPLPVATLDGHYLSVLQGKPAALVARMPGQHCSRPEPHHCEAMGRTLALMHTSGSSFPLYRKPDCHPAWLKQTADQVMPHLDEADARLLQAEMVFQHTIPVADLPSSTLHADLFRDNVLFANDQPSAILDLYFACTGPCLHDLAVLVNDWCSLPNGALEPLGLQACLQAYQAVRPWNALEQQYWPAMLRGAALQFWLSRLLARHYPRSGELTWQKDPDEFRARLQQRAALLTPSGNGVTVDARRLLCPLPVIRVQAAVEQLPPGTTVTAICTDPGALHDIPAWARIHGHRVLTTGTQGRDHTITLQTGAGS